MSEVVKLVGRLLIKITPWPFFAFVLVSVFMPATMHRQPDYERGAIWLVLYCVPVPRDQRGLYGRRGMS